MKVMIFGIFDGLHDGHKFFIEQALRQAQGDSHLVVVIGRDSFVKSFKHKQPKHSEQERARALKREYPEATVVLGDEELGSYGVVKTHWPAMICLGHDQEELGKDLRAKMASQEINEIRIITMSKL